MDYSDRSAHGRFTAIFNPHFWAFWMAAAQQMIGPAVLGERLDAAKTMKTVSLPPLIEHQS
jgi:hypothetical protein